MPRIAYVNGRYVPHGSAAVHIEDRGFQFADGVYEVCAVRSGHTMDLGAHLDRLKRSLGELRIEPPMSRAALTQVLAETILRNRVRHGLVYMQITRGVARRDHGFPNAARPSLVVIADSTDPERNRRLETEGVAIATAPDLRWKRCDIKSVALLPNVLAKQAAREAGAFEAWLADSDGYITEGASTNAWIVTKKGELVTRPLSDAILSGVTRQNVLAAAHALRLPVVERAFSAAEARDSAEAFLTATTVLIVPVIEIDSVPIGRGAPGPVTKRLIAKLPWR